MMKKQSKQRADIIRRARTLLAEIEQYFVDLERWNDNSQARKAGCYPIDPDLDGQLGRMRDGLIRMLAAEDRGGHGGEDRP